MRAPDKKRPLEIRNGLRNTRFQDLILFEAVARTGSLASGARELRLRFPHVTKVIQRLEKDLRVPLLKRTSLGVSLTTEGEEFLDFTKKILESIEKTPPLVNQFEQPETRMLTVVGPMFLLAHLLAPVADRSLSGTGLGLRLIDSPNSQMLAQSSRDTFELAIHCDELSWSRAWKSYPIGTVEWLLCAREDHPLGSRCVEKEVLRYPFVIPAVLGLQGTRVGDDFCPVPPKQRARFLEVSSGEIGLRTVENTDQMIFLPAIQARELIARKRVKSIHVKDWAPVRKTAYLTVNQDKTMQRWVNSLLSELEIELTRKTG